MALSITKSKQQFKADSDAGAAIVQFNLLLDELRVWATRLDAETLANSDYVTRLDAAVSKIGNLSGTAFTSSTY